MSKEEELPTVAEWVKEAPDYAVGFWIAGAVAVIFNVVLFVHFFKTHVNTVNSATKSSRNDRMERNFLIIAGISPVSRKKIGRNKKKRKRKSFFFFPALLCCRSSGFRVMQECGLFGQQSSLSSFIICKQESFSFSLFRFVLSLFSIFTESGK
jgi:hypothetical protein